MVQVARFLKSWFGLQAFILTVIFAYTLYRLATGFEAGTLPDRFRPGVEIILLAVPCAAVVTGTAWWKLRQGSASAWLWAMAASIMNLPMLGLGTIAGIAGLVVFRHKDIAGRVAVEIARENTHQDYIPGDGTSKWIEAASVVGQVFFFVAGNALWRTWANVAGLPHSRWLGGVVAYSAALFTAIFWHEAGHVTAGWLAEMKLRQFVVGPFEWALRAGAWRFKFNAMGLWGRGLAGMVPIHLKNLPGRNIFMLMGGPIGSLVVGSAAALATISAKGYPWQAGWEYFSALATMGLGQFLVNLLPLKPENSGYSDGAQIYQLASRGHWADVHMAFAMVGSTLVTPQRPRDYDIELLERSARFLTQGRKAVLLRIYACFYFMDTGQTENVRAALRGAEDICPLVMAGPEAALHAELVFINALYQRDAAQARLWWDRMEQASTVDTRTEYWRARAALHWIEGGQGEALIAWQKGYALAQSLPQAGAYDFDRWCFAELKRAMDETGESGVARLGAQLQQAAKREPAFAEDPMHVQ